MMLPEKHPERHSLEIRARIRKSRREGRREETGKRRSPRASHGHALGTNRSRRGPEQRVPQRIASH